jgi:hypothetical protein
LGKRAVWRFLIDALLFVAVVIVVCGYLVMLAVHLER